jgi:thioredoxin-dependent peroxiredoxin
MLGKPVPEFSLLSTGGTTFKSSGSRGRKLVL